MPYPEDALEPFLSAENLRFHRRKHERYVARTNDLVRGTSLAKMSTNAIVLHARQALHQPRAERAWQVYEQASQAWNHTMMWLSMRPPTTADPPPEADRLAERWMEAAKSVFASGWVWLVLRDGDLDVEATADADRPASGEPVLVMDAWEHAFYMDYPDAKDEYVEAWWDRLANWDFARARIRGHWPGELA